MESKRADYADILQLADTLRASIVKNSDGENAYIDGLNDTVIGKKAGISIYTVRNVRKSLFGKVKFSAPRRVTKPEPKADRLDALEAKLDEMMAILRKIL